MRTRWGVAVIAAGATAAVIGAAGSLAGFAPPALAQTTPTAGQVEEVVVTARRREERLQDAPVAVTAFSAEALAVDWLH